MHEVTAIVKKCRKGDGKAGKPWCLYTKDGSRLLGAHASQEDAYKQEAAIKHSQAKGSVDPHYPRVVYFPSQSPDTIYFKVETSPTHRYLYRISSHRLRRYRGVRQGQAFWDFLQREGEDTDPDVVATLIAVGL